MFEVRVLHDFYLSENDSGASFFSLTDTQQTNRLVKLLNAEQYDMRQDLDIVPDMATKEIFRSHKMKLLPSSFGFVLALEVKMEDDGGAAFYRPAVSMPDSLRLVFKMVGKNGSFVNFTNLTVSDTVPAQYFFSNESTQTVGAAKVLSNPAAEFDPAKDYVMGDLVKSGGVLKEVYFRVQDNVRALVDVAGDGFVTMGDKHLLPKKFDYRIKTPVAGIVKFTLSDEGGATVKTIEKNATSSIRRFNLDFSNTDDPDPLPIADGFYDLLVEENGTTVVDRQVLLSDKYYSTNQMGVLEFQPKTTDPQFGLLDGDGRLFTHIQADGTKVLHPIFEMRFLSRRTFWRYRKSEGFNAGDTGISDQLVLVGDKLVTKKPMALTRSMRLFPSLSGANMPNPHPDQLLVDGKKLMNDIYVSSVNRLE